MKAIETTILQNRGEAILRLPFHQRVHVPFVELASDTVEATSGIVGKVLDTIFAIGAEIFVLRVPQKRSDSEPASHLRCLRFITSLSDVVAELKRDAGIPESTSLMMPALMFLCPMSPVSGLVVSSMVQPTQLLCLSGVLVSLGLGNNFLSRHSRLSERHLLRTGAFIAAVNSGLYVILASQGADLAVQLPMVEHATMFVHGAGQLLMAPMLVRNLAILMGCSTADTVPAIACTAVSASAYVAASVVGDPGHALVLIGSGVLTMHMALNCLVRCHSATSAKLGDLNYMRAAVALDLLTLTSGSAALANAMTIAWSPLAPQTEMGIWFFIEMLQNLGVTHLTLSAKEALEKAENLRRCS